MSLTGKRLILLIVLFIGACFFISAQQLNKNTSPSAQNASNTQSANALASTTPAPTSAPAAKDADAKNPVAEKPDEKTKTASNTTSSAGKSVDQKTPAKVKSVSVDAVAKPRPNVPLNSKVNVSKTSTSGVETSDRNNVVSVAVNKKNGRTGDNVASKTAGLDQKTGKANKRSHSARAAKRNVQSQHRALTKPNKRKRAVVKSKRRKLAVKKRVKSRRRVAYAAPKRIVERRRRRTVRTRRHTRHVRNRRRAHRARVARVTPKRVKVVRRKLKPLPAAEKWISPTKFWRVWREE